MAHVTSSTSIGALHAKTMIVFSDLLCYDHVQVQHLSTIRIMIIVLLQSSGTTGVEVVLWHIIIVVVVRYNVNDKMHYTWLSLSLFLSQIYIHKFTLV